MSLYVDVYLNIPVNRSFVYKVPDNYKNSVKKFIRVSVPFGKRRLVGLIVNIKNQLEEEEKKFNIKEIYLIIDKEPVLNEKEYKFAKWIAKNYFSSIGEVLPLFFPKGKKEKKFIIDSENNNILSYKLTPAQERVFKGIKEYIDKGIFKTFLIYGVTGSGKTEIYFHIIKEIIKKDKQVILLIPEIALTPQLINFFYSRLKDKVAVIHSNLKKSYRLNQYNLIKQNIAKVIIGPRSALFAPAYNLGAIIIDEEHDDSYKSNSKPRFLVRNIALFKAKIYNAIVVLGSATPSLESFYSSQKGVIKYFELNERYNKGSLPEIEILDLKKEKKVKDFFLTEKLLSEIKKTLTRKEKVILYLNRRGFSNTVQCLSCGEFLYCPNCSIPLTYHSAHNKLKCHYCGYEVKKYEKCPLCGSDKLIYKGTGTEKIEKIIKETFSDHVIERFDSDSVKEKGGYEKILERFRKGEIDILIGTQMITKGHHFPDVTLVGIINADTFLNFPDFRANEKTFQTIVQVAGRAGRGNKEGKVILQTLRPGHYAIDCALTQDYKTFYRNEIKIRLEAFYPPFARLLRVVVRSTNRKAAETYISKIGNFVKKTFIDYQERIKKRLIKEVFAEFNYNLTLSDKVVFLGPSSAPFEKIDKNYRFHFIIKSNNVKYLRAIGDLILNRFPNKNNVYVELDLDPVSML